MSTISTQSNQPQVFNSGDCYERDTVIITQHIKAHRTAQAIFATTVILGLATVVAIGFAWSAAVLSPILSIVLLGTALIIIAVASYCIIPHIRFVNSWLQMAFNTLIAEDSGNITREKLAVLTKLGKHYTHMTIDNIRTKANSRKWEQSDFNSILNRCPCMKTITTSEDQSLNAFADNFYKEHPAFSHPNMQPESITWIS